MCRIIVLCKTVMPAYLITYDLNSPGQKHQKLHSFITEHFPYAKLSESSFAVKSKKSSEQVFDLVKGYIDSNDDLFVIQLTRPYSGYGEKNVIKWLNDFL